MERIGSTYRATILVAAGGTAILSVFVLAGSHNITLNLNRAFIRLMGGRFVLEDAKPSRAICKCMLA